MRCQKCHNEISKYNQCCPRCGYSNSFYGTDQKFQYHMKLNHVTDYEKYETPSINENISNQPVLKYFMYSMSFLTVISFLKAFLDSECFRYIDSFFVLFFVFLFFSFYISCLAALFAKAGSVWWYALLPIYNLFILSKLVFKNGFFCIFIFIPFIQIIYLILFVYCLSKKFAYHFFLLLFLFPITFPMLVFSKKYQYQDYYEYAK